MKLLADAICEARYDKNNDAVSYHVQSALRRPSENHSEEFAPAVERFVIGSAEGVAVRDLAMRLGSNGNQLERREILLPLPVFWLEVDFFSEVSGFPARFGYFVFPPRENGEVSVAVIVSPSRGGKLAANPAFAFALIIGADKKISDNVRISETISRQPKDARERAVSLASYLFEASLVSITQSKMATTRRMHRFEGRPDIAKIMRRQSLRGAPVYSFNRVEFSFIRAAIERGEINAQGFGEKRGHWVIGHWRWLEKNVAEPHYTWVTPHIRGNEALGFVTKERRMKGETA